MAENENTYAGESLQRMYLELAHVVPPECKSVRDLRSETLIAELTRALQGIRDDILPEFLADRPGSYRAIHALNDAIRRAEESD